ncbi:MAG: hypothetical protein H7Y32_18670 [Chloroflexales bacterium]|nr:hypothetical protein [Chloroflexales bacterium]
MAPGRYGRPRLTNEDDKRYREHVAQFTLQRGNNKAMRPPRQRDLFGGEAEAALRAWLGETLTISDRRILEYEERRNRRGTMKYREIDAVVLNDAERSVWVFEIKASRTGGSLRKAIGQLRETREILLLLYRKVFTTVLLVDTGIPADDAAVVELIASANPPPRPPMTLQAALETLPEVRTIASLSERSADPDQTDLLRFSVDAIIALAGKENLSLDWDADDLPDDEETEPPPAAETFYSSPDEADDSDDDNPLAAALRRAGMKDG